MTFVKRVIRSLKTRSRPQPIDIYRTTSRSSNLTTGVDTVVREKLHIAKAIVMPPQVQFQAPQTNPSGQMKFGGFLEIQTTSVMLDGKDVGDFEINIEDCQVIFAGKRYEIFKIQPYDKEAYVLILKGVEGAIPEAIQDATASQSIQFSESYSGTLL